MEILLSAEPGVEPGSRPAILEQRFKLLETEPMAQDFRSSGAGAARERHG
jgi:hypothetical protein